MKKETLKTVINFIITILTAIASAFVLVRARANRPLQSYLSIFH